MKEGGRDVEDGDELLFVTYFDGLFDEGVSCSLINVDY